MTTTRRAGQSSAAAASLNPPALHPQASPAPTASRGFHPSAHSLLWVGGLAAGEPLEGGEAAHVKLLACTGFGQRVAGHASAIATRQRAPRAAGGVPDATLFPCRAVPLRAKAASRACSMLLAWYQHPVGNQRMVCSTQRAAPSSRDAPNSRWASASTLAISTRFLSLGSAAMASPSCWYTGTRLLQWPHPACRAEAGSAQEGHSRRGRGWQRVLARALVRPAASECSRGML